MKSHVLLLDCGFHLLDVTPCADGRLAHAIAYAAKVVPEMDKDQVVVINLSGRGDKDVTEVMRLLGGEL